MGKAQQVMQGGGQARHVRRVCESVLVAVVGGRGCGVLYRTALDFAAAGRQGMRGQSDLTGLLMG